MVIEAIKSKFSIFPTPKYLSIRNVKIPQEANIPLLVFEKAKEKVSRLAMKKTTKKIGMTKIVDGSMK
jgi:hypothetical protein